MKQSHKVLLLFIDLVYTLPVKSLETPTHAIRKKAKYRQASNTYFVVAVFILFHFKALFLHIP